MPRAAKPLRERLRERLHRDLPGTQISFEAADIVTPGDELRLAHPHRSGGAGSQPAERLRLRAEGSSETGEAHFLRDLQFAQADNYPTLDINIDRERAGQFGLTMADVVHSVVPATSSSRFTEPNYWRDPNSGNAFQIQVELPQNRMQSVDKRGRRAGDAGRPPRQPLLDRYRQLEAGHHAGPDRTLSTASTWSA